MKRARALIVDDNVELADNLREILGSLRDFDVDCAVARSAAEALSLVGEHGAELDLAFIDLRLPDADGLGLVPTLKELCPFTEIVIITGDATLETALRAVGQGAFAYVIKPFRGDELTLTATRALAKSALVKERDALSKSLEQSAQRHREVVESIPALVLALDAAGKIVIWNRRLEALTGFSRDEMLGKPGRELVGAGGDRKLPLKSGGHRMVRWQIAEISEPDTLYALGIDVTDEREMLRRTLRAERLAAVGTLAAGLAHEVRNPLNSAALQLQLLRRRIERGQLETAELVAVVDVVHQEIKRLDRLVTDFLAFAQPRQLELRTCSLNELVARVVDQFRGEAEERGIRLEPSLDPATGDVDVDADRMRQVLLNLVRNSLEAMPNGGKLSVRTHAADASGNVAIEVEDSGPGFADEAPIFDAFYTTKESGTGLGLAIVHRIVADHDGALTSESRPGRTVFRVSLAQRPARAAAHNLR